MKRAVGKLSTVGALKKASEKAKLKKMTKEEKVKYKAGKRNNDSDSEYSYRSVVSAGGTRHVNRRRKREDGTYSAEESYHSSQDEEGEARRRRRRRDREHGDDSDHSYYSVVSEGGTRHVRRRKRHEDGTYSRSESYRSQADVENSDVEVDDNGTNRSKGSLSDDETADESEYDLESDVSTYSEVSEGGTRYKLQKKRIRDADGNVIGYGDPKPAVKKKGSDRVTKGSIGGEKDIASLKMKRNGELLREATCDSLSQLRQEGENLVEANQEWPGEPAENIEQKILEDENRIPSDFSDATTEDDIDLSKLNPAQRRQYLAQREKRRKEREKRRREKYGDKYDEIMKKKMAAKNPAMAEKLAEAEREREKTMDHLKVDDPSSGRRRSSNASLTGRSSRPKSMVTYDKGPPRDMGYDKTVDNRELGLAHDDWTKKRDYDSNKRRKKSASDGRGDGQEFIPKLHRETTMLKPLPTIPQGKMLEDKDDTSTNDGSKTNRSIKFGDTSEDDRSEIDLEKRRQEEERRKEEEERAARAVFDVDNNGRLILKKKKIDLNNITDEELEALGIDPTLSAVEIAKKLKKMFGKDLVITEGGKLIGTKHIDEYSDDISDSELAKDPDLNVDTLRGLRRVNIIMQRGGSALRRHMEKIIAISRLGPDRFAKDLDERDKDIDFLSHYHLVDPSRIESYARAFVVEDSDLDTVINSSEARVALDGVPFVSQITHKQLDYVMRVLHIDDASLITFRMFAVVTALCERVTTMDSLSQKLLEICSLADIERKLDLYKAMFYHNTQSDRTTNFITSDSLKIELIAGGLNWKQQEYIMEKMEPNDWGEISFLDYMCYIPLFLSMHDNICMNPLDNSNQKYSRPPRQRPPSVQRDINPLGCSLSKASAYWTRKRALEEMVFPSNNAKQMSKGYLKLIDKYNTEKIQRLMAFENKRQTSMMSKESSDLSDSSFSKENIYT